MIENRGAIFWRRSLFYFQAKIKFFNFAEVLFDNQDLTHLKNQNQDPLTLFIFANFYFFRALSRSDSRALFQSALEIFQTHFLPKTNLKLRHPSHQSTSLPHSLSKPRNTPHSHNHLHLHTHSHFLNSISPCYQKYKYILFTKKVAE